MVEGRERFRPPARIASTRSGSAEWVWEDLERDLSIELGVACAIDLTHAAGAERADDFVGAESGPILKHVGVGALYVPALLRASAIHRSLGGGGAERPALERRVAYDPPATSLARR